MTELSLAESPKPYMGQVSKALARVFEQEKRDDWEQNLTVVHSLGKVMVAHVGPAVYDGAFRRGATALTVASLDKYAFAFKRHLFVPVAEDSFEPISDFSCKTSCYGFEMRATTFDTDMQDGVLHFFKTLNQEEGHAKVADWLVNNELRRLDKAHPECNFYSAYDFTFEGRLGMYEGHIFSPEEEDAIRQVRESRIVSGRRPAPLQLEQAA